MLKYAEIANLGWKYEYRTPQEAADACNTWLSNINSNALKWGLGGAGVLVLANVLRRGLKGRKIRFRDILVPTILGFGGTYLGKAGYDLIGGMGYSGRQYDTSKLKSGDTVYVGVSGAGGSPGGDLDEVMAQNLGEGNYAIFSHRDADKAVEFVNNLPEGVNAKVFMHSFGGKHGPRIQQGVQNKNVQYATADAVGWTGKFTGQRPVGTQYLPKDNRVDWTSDDVIAELGGRWWDKKHTDTRYVPGRHSTILNPAFQDFMGDQDVQWAKEQFGEQGWRPY